uniref:Uncharacterized protein n=1 Tax=Lepeophtheirus salmonis TaxID=72036 RepID=A0A0K2VJR9_LEPSM
MTPIQILNGLNLQERKVYLGAGQEREENTSSFIRSILNSLLLTNYFAEIISSLVSS